MKNVVRNLARHFFVVAVILLLASSGFAQTNSGLAAKIKRIINRPLYRHSFFGIEVYCLDDHKVVYEMNAQKLFVPASTTKLLTEGTALQLLGPDFRFNTYIYRTGPITPGGTLRGDLVLVGSGDPNLSGRIRPNGTLAYVKIGYDHTYGGDINTKAVPRDPLLVIHQFAKEIAARGIKRIEGRVLVDASLFPEGTKELGTGAVISPVEVNDNLIDVTATPGQTAGDPVKLRVSPVTPYTKFVNEATTGAAGTPFAIQWVKDQERPNGSRVVTVDGTMPAGGPSILYSYKVPEPSRFAEMALVQALRQDDVKANFSPYGQPVDFSRLSSSFTKANVVAEHVSPPFSQEVKITLKLSQNLHASTTLYILGAMLAHAHKNALQAGFNLEHGFLEKAGLDLSGAVQSDGAGGAAMFTPDFMCHYLAYMAEQKDFEVFHHALPILGRDGTLFNIQVHSPAAGHVFAKTGTIDAPNLLDEDLVLTGKGLAGYMTAANGRRYTFALYANNVPLPAEGLDVEESTAGQALGEIAAAIYTAGP